MRGDERGEETSETSETSEGGVSDRRGDTQRTSAQWVSPWDEGVEFSEEQGAKVMFTAHNCCNSKFLFYVPLLSFLARHIHLSSHYIATRCFNRYDPFAAYSLQSLRTKQYSQRKTSRLRNLAQPSRLELRCIECDEMIIYTSL